MQHSPQRLILAIVLADNKLIIFLRDVTQAYVQDDTIVSIAIFLILPASIGQPPDTLLRVE